MEINLSAREKEYYIDRITGELKEEAIYCEETLRFLYASKIGKPFGLILAKCSFFSRFLGWWYSQPWTKPKILPFIKRHGIDVSECKQSVASYSSFNAFFIRTLKKECRPFADGLIMPADGRYLVYQEACCCENFKIKKKSFSIKKLIDDAVLAKKYLDGSMVIARLAPSDYHHFHFPCDCVPGKARLINGPLYPVHPLAIIQNIAFLVENKRMITELTTKNYGTILYIEIGATAVGSIHQTYFPGLSYKKGEEKGYFSFGGSSIILLFERGKVKLASDILKNSNQNIETLCLMGQPLTEAIS